MKRLASILLLLCGSVASAGVHYSGESFRTLPAKWRGFLPDHRQLRLIAAPSGPLRDQYAAAALKLESIAKDRALNAEEAADLGAIRIRLGQPQQALDGLRTARRRHADHFRLASNLGTAWQLAGDLDQAVAALADAVRLAPKKWKQAEQFHLALVRLRQKETGTTEKPDDLFRDSPLSLTQKVAITQQLALWLPNDGRLLRLLGTLAEDDQDFRTAANIFDGCVIEYAMRSSDLRTKRLQARATVEELEAKGHRMTKTTIAFASSRALLHGIDPSRLPPIDPNGVNGLPWPAILETELSPRGVPTFLKYIEQLDGKQVRITGFMAPAGNATTDLTGFLLTEFAVGCWFCESPGPTQLVTVELRNGTTMNAVRTGIKVIGTLRLNHDEPERYPFTITDAVVGNVD